jgi:hypothetical protein
MRHDAEGRIVEVGARTRTIPPALRRALQHRDRGCRFPGCSVRFGQGHHHEEGYQVDRQPDGELQFRRPDGRILPEVPPPPRVGDDPLGTIRARNEAEGLQLHARTAIPNWGGEGLNVGWAIDVLHPLANPLAR